jgi:hypothetical protein
MWKRRNQGIKNRTAWNTTFSEAEQKKAEQVYKQFHQWYIFSGPTVTVMSPETLVWIKTKLIPFFANL